ncbi:MAG: YncE family protein [Halobacteriaceae archaeon]
MTPLLAAVCCQDADCLALYQVDGGLDPAGEVPVGGHPVHATVAADRVFVATMDERSVSVVDVDGAVETVPTGVLGPSHFAAAADRLFVPCTGGDAVAVLDPEALALDGRVLVGAEPHEMAVRDGTGYVGSRADGVVSLVDLAAGERRRDVPVPPAADADVARVQGVEAGESAVYAVDQRGAAVVALTETRGITGRAAVGADPYDLTVTGGRVYVPGRDAGTVHEFRADADLTPVATHDVGERPVEVVSVPDTDGPWVLHRESPRLQSLSGPVVDLPAGGLDCHPVGPGRVLVSHYDDDAVSLVDLPGGTVDVVDAPSRPFGLLTV